MQPQTAYIQDFLGHLRGVKMAGMGQWMALCPAHDDHDPSLSIKVDTQGRILLHCFAGCSREAILARLDLPEAALAPLRLCEAEPNDKHGEGKKTVYEYKDEQGRLLFQVVRQNLAGGRKRVHQRAPDPHNPGRWLQDGLGKYSLKGIRRVLYNLPAVLAAEVVWIVEGEKCAEALIQRGLVATTNPGGARKWQEEYAAALRGKQVRILPDNDKPGQQHALAVAHSVVGCAASTRLIPLTGLPDKGDIYDWLQQHSIDELRSLANDTPEWQPNPDLAPAATEEEARDKKSSAQQIIEIGLTAELFHSDRDEAFARFPVNGHRQTWPVRSRTFKGWLTKQYFEATGKTLSAQALEDALRLLEAKATFDGHKIPLALRVAGDARTLWLDLADEMWRAVHISPNGWQIVSEPPTLFRRYAPSEAQVEPVHGGCLERLREFANVTNEDGFKELMVWLVAAFFPSIAHPILVVHGEQGTAKSTLVRMLNRLIDPSKTPLRCEPGKHSDWVQSADHAWMVCLDNVSKLPTWLSDGLCRGVTGEGFAKRQLYTDEEDVIISFRRIFVLTGIEVVAEKPDLLDRSLLLPLEPISEAKRRPEAEVLDAFEAARPKLLGALLDLVAKVLSVLPTVTTERLPRMADFARIGVAVEQVLGWEEGTFLAIYTENMKEQHAEALASSVVAEALQTYLLPGDTWKGTATQLLDALKSHAQQQGKKATQRDWPKTPKDLSGHLRRIAPNLRAIGIEAVFTTPHAKRYITLTREPCESSIPCVL